MMLEKLANFLSKHESLPNRLTLEMGQRIREARLSVGMTPDTLAEHIYATLARVEAIEAGTERVEAEELVYLVGTLRRPITYFFPDWVQEQYVQTR